MNYVEPTRLCVPSKQVVNQGTEKDMQKKKKKKKNPCMPVFTTALLTIAKTREAA